MELQSSRKNIKLLQLLKRREFFAVQLNPDKTDACEIVEIPLGNMSDVWLLIRGDENCKQARIGFVTDAGTLVNKMHVTKDRPARIGLAWTAGTATGSRDGVKLHCQMLRDGARDNVFDITIDTSFVSDRLPPPEISFARKIDRIEFGHNASGRTMLAEIDLSEPARSRRYVGKSNEVVLTAEANLSFPGDADRIRLRLHLGLAPLSPESRRELDRITLRWLGAGQHGISLPDAAFNESSDRNQGSGHRAFVSRATEPERTDRTDTNGGTGARPARRCPANSPASRPPIQDRGAFRRARRHSW